MGGSFFPAENIDTATLDAGVQTESATWLTKFFQKFKPQGFKALETRLGHMIQTKISPTEPIDSNISRELMISFAYPVYTCAFRRLDGKIRIEYDVRKHDNTGAFALTANEGAIFKPYLLANMWRKATLVIGSTEFNWNYDYGLTHYIEKLLTLRKEHYDRERDMTGFVVQRAYTTPNKASLPQPAADRWVHPLFDIPAPITVAPGPGNAAWNQTDWETLWDGGLAIPKAGKRKTLYGNLPHPLFNDDKMWPPECPMTLRLEPNKAAKIFYANPNLVPTLRIQRIQIIDTVYPVSDEMMEKSATDVINKSLSWDFAFTTPQTIWRNLSNATVIDYPNVWNGPWPRLIVFSFHPTACRTETKPNTNKFMSKFPPLKRFTVYSGQNEYPQRGGIEFRNIPALATPTKMDDYHTTAEIKQIIEDNKDIFDDVQRVVAHPNDVGLLYWDAKQFFTSQFFLPVAFTPIPQNAEVRNVVFPKETGEMGVRLEFVHEINGDEWSMCMTCFKDADLTLTPPAWTAVGTW